MSLTMREWSMSSDVPMSWAEAHAWCQALREQGHNDWRLPTREELVSLVNYEKHDPACDLPDTASFGYWSASTYAPYPTFAWTVYFGSGYVVYFDKAGSLYVRAVRGGA